MYKYVYFINKKKVLRTMRRSKIQKSLKNIKQMVKKIYSKKTAKQSGTNL